MKPLAFVWPYAFAFWTAYVWAFWPEFGIVRRGQRSAGSTDSKSLQVILLGMWLGYLGAFPLAWVQRFQLAAAYQVAAFWFGLAVLLSGSLLRRHCWRMLGASFTGDVQARPDQQVVTRGAYKLLRHPAYTGGILLNTGIGIALGSWGSALLLAVTSFLVYGYRIAVEERALLAAIGEPYREFMSTRKRLIPFIY
jgi:protein-S-isoprenylcysteine O-methyltransferase Ste14